MGKIKRRLESAPRHGWHGESNIPNLDLLRPGTLIQLAGSAHVDDAYVDGIHRYEYTWYPIPLEVDVCWMIVDVVEGDLRYRAFSSPEYHGYRVILDDETSFELLPSSYLNDGVLELIREKMVDYISVQGVCYRVISSLPS